MSKMFLILSLFLASYIKPDSYFQFERLAIGQIPKIERAQKGTKFQLRSSIRVSKDFFPGARVHELMQPLVYVRKEKDFAIDLQVEYFYSRDDSVRLITYSWDTKAVTRNLNYQDLSSQDPGSLEKWNEKYDKVASMFNKALGDPTEGNGMLRSGGKPVYDKWNQRYLKWEAATCAAELKMNWYEKETKVNEVATIVPTYRIRAKVYWD